jgi:hypothetical protein
MTEFPANPTDASICRLLAAEPLPTAIIAGRLDVPERTVRHRLYRLRQAGTVASGPDGLHSLAALARPDRAAGPLPAPVTRVVKTAGPAESDLATGPLPAHVVPAGATGQSPSDRSSAHHGGHARARTVLATAALGLAVAGGIALIVRSRRMSPPPPAPPTGFGNAGDPWGSMRGPSW